MGHVCPWWIGYVLLFPLRRLRHSPAKWLGPFVREGMTVLEPGPAMGFFTLDLARMVGAGGRVVAIDVQRKMLEVLGRRLRKAGLADRVDVRLADGEHLGIEDLAGRVDLVAAIYTVHEMPSAEAFYSQAYSALKPGGRLLLAEPRGHVSRASFEESLATAGRAGFKLEPGAPFGGTRAALLVKG